MNHRSNNQQRGVAHLLLLLLIVVIAGAGFVGWRVFSKPVATRQPVISTKPAGDAKDEPAAAETKQVPEGFIKAELQEIGISFAYPKDWGSVSAAPGREQKHLAAGAEYEIKFSGNDKVTAGVRSSDWKHAEDLGHGGIVYAAALAAATYQGLVKEPGDEGGFPAKTYKHDATSFIISLPYGGEGCEGVGELLVRKLDHKSYPGIAFLYEDKSVINEPFGDEVCQGDAFMKYISTENAETFKKIDASIVLL